MTIRNIFPGQVVDDNSPLANIATIVETLNQITVNEGTNITLKFIDISYVNFKNLFFDNQNFNLNILLIRNPSYSKYFTNDLQRVIDSNVDDGSYPYRLYNLLRKHYQNGLGNQPSDSWSSSSLTLFQRKISEQKTLFDVGCGICPTCTLTLDEMFATWADQGLEMSGNVPKSVTKSPIAVITTVFQSTTSRVNDFIVSWPYRVDFTGVTDRYLEDG